MSELAPTGGETLDHVRKQDRRSLGILPEPFRKPVGFFWACNQHLLPSPLPLATRLHLWIAKEGLTVEELKTALNRCSTPDRCSEIHFVGQLLAAVAKEIDSVIRRRPGYVDPRACERAEDIKRQRELILAGK